MKSIDDRPLGKRINESVRQGKLVPATVVDIFFDKVTVRLSGDGALMRGLRVVGGPVDPGQKVQVDFTTTEPTVIAIAKEWVSNDDLANALKAITGSTLAQEAAITIIVYSGGQVKAMYPSTDTGLANALSNSGNGDVVYLPDIDVAGSFTVPDDVSITGVSSRQSIIRGDLTLGNGCLLENLCVLYGSDSESAVTAITAAGSGDASFIRNCEIHGYNCGNGQGSAITLQSGTELYVEKSTIIGDSMNGTSYTIVGASGSTCKVTQSFVYGGTDYYSGSGVYEYSNLEFKTEITRACTYIPPAMWSSFVSGNNLYNALVPPDQNYDLSALSSGVTVTHVHQDSVAGSSRYVSTIAQVGDYLYYIDQSTVGIGKSNHFVIVEYNIQTQAKVSLDAGQYGTTGYTPNCFAMADERIAYVVYQSYPDYDMDVFKLDFANETVENVHSHPYPADMYETGATAYLKPGGVVTLQDDSGNKHIIAYGDLSYNNGGYTPDPDYSRLRGIWIMHYDPTDNSWTDYEETYNTTMHFLSNTWYTPPMSHGSKFAVVPSVSVFSAEYSNGTSVIGGGGVGVYVQVLMMFDVETKEIEKFYREKAMVDWGGICYNYYVGVCHTTGEFFFTWQNGEGANVNFWDNMYKYNIVQQALTHLGEPTTSGSWRIVSTDTECYLCDMQTYTPRSFVIHKGSDFTVIDSDYNSKVELGYADDNGYFWLYNTTDEKLYGYNILDDTDTISITVAKADLNEGGNNPNYHAIMMVDMIVVAEREGSSPNYKSNIYMIRATA